MSGSYTTLISVLLLDSRVDEPKGKSEVSLGGHGVPCSSRSTIFIIFYGFVT